MFRNRGEKRQLLENKKGRIKSMNKKMNNKGFSLVELIIVIAIMAILIGVLAPAYLRYVEKSRKSTDVDAISSVMNAMEVVAIDPEYAQYVKNNTKITATFTSGTGDMTITCTGGSDATGEGKIKAAMDGIVGAYTLKSSDWKSAEQVVEGTIDAANGKVKFTAPEAIKEYADSLKTKVNASQGE